MVWSKLSKVIFLYLIIFPVWATEDLTSETYISPAYGLYLHGDYYYNMGDSVNWKVTGNTYEVNGYYALRDSSNSFVDIACRLNSPVGGVVYMCIEEIRDGTYQTAICEYMGYYEDIGTYDYFSKTLDLNDYDVESGKFYAYCKIIFEGGAGLSISDKYTYYYNAEDAYDKRSLITLTSSNNISDGIVTIELNSTIVNEFNEYDIVYDNGNYSLSGTLSNIIITDTSRTKVYPFYVDEFKGGYYDFNNNTDDNAILKVYIDEDVTSKGLYLYYNYNKANVSYDGYYQYAKDDNNNPFIIYQAFSDWRWSLPQLSNMYGVYSKNLFDRGNYFGGTLANFMSPMNINYINYTTGTGGGKPYIDRIVAYPNNVVVVNHFLERIYNSTNDYISISGNVGNYAIFYNESKFCLDSDLIYCINESVYDYFVFNYTGTLEYLYNFSNIDYITSSSTIYLYQNTTFSNATLTVYDIGETFINDFWLKGILTTQESGIFICSFTNGTSIGSINVPSSEYATTYDLILTHNIGNEDYFFNETNLTEIEYNCKYISESGGIIDDGNNTITISNDRIFIYNIVPVNHKIQDLTSINLRMDMDYNYTSPTTQFKLYINDLNCLETYQDKCIRFGTLDSVYSYIDNDTESIDIDYTGDYESCYIIYYLFNKGGDEVWTYRQICINEQIGLVLPDSPTITFVDWNDTTIITSIEDVEELFWQNPLYYISSWTFQNFIMAYTSENAQNIFLVLFTIIFNFYFISFLVVCGAYLQFKELKLSIVFGYIAMYGFTLVGWCSSFTTGFLTLFAAVSFYIYMRYGSL